MTDKIKPILGGASSPELNPIVKRKPRPKVALKPSPSASASPSPSPDNDDPSYPGIGQHILGASDDLPS